ncbi:hypothetical protein [Peredibacter starrii]|uniref:PilJ/NarX-like methyl-accepting chemotaxis transducer n=1 Tax=Peredibacter starrii TaxID=28202 RepID=A0AAX4HQ95_9BACT|nr:hypothetical protein [Peredibacter starrii]WPU65220.1 hypothetical protein SOO65_00470 [Peredibacter starrii]
MNFKKLITGMMVLASLTVQAGEGGSGIGGGMNFALINWCDDASIMVRETRAEALERLNYNNDKIGALRVFYNGLIAAAASSEQAPQAQDNSLTYRAITRGIRLAQLLEIPSVINGGKLPDGALIQHNHMQGLLSFMDWYTLHIEDVAFRVDRDHYIPYSTQGRPMGVRELEELLVDIAVSQLTGLEQRFVRLKSDRSTYFTAIPVTQYMQALSYLSAEVANDLKETLFSNALECQSKLLVRLSRNVQTYLDGRTSTKEDAIKLNRFVLEVRSITKQIESRSCAY